MGSWGCPHEIQGICQKVAKRACDPGMRGCVLAGRYVFANSEDKNSRLRQRQDRFNEEALSPQSTHGVENG